MATSDDAAPPSAAPTTFDRAADARYRANERFLNLEPSADDDRRWRQPLVPGLTGGRGDLFGGCAVGAVIAGLERCTGRPLAWITSQFLAPSRPPQVLDFTVDRLVQGRNLSQATVVASVDGTDVLTFQAALGARPALADDLRWVSRPDVPGPDACDPVEVPPGPGGLRPRFDCRQVPATGAAGSGISRWWYRILPDDPAVAAARAGETVGPDLGDPALLAIVLDFVPMALSAALDRPLFGASLDNTVRAVERVPTEWVLAELALESLHRGISHITGRTWSADGHLLCTGSQTCVVTERPPG